MSRPDPINEETVRRIVSSCGISSVARSNIGRESLVVLDVASYEVMRLEIGHLQH